MKKGTSVRQSGSEIRRLKEQDALTEEQVGLLLYSPDARLELMNATSGDSDALATGAISRILQHAEAAAREEVESELNRERSLRQEAEAANAAEKERAALRTSEAQRLADRSEQIARTLSWGPSPVARRYS